MNPLDDSFIIDGQGAYFYYKYMQYCLDVKRINDKIFKLYAKERKRSGYQKRIQQKKKVKYHALLETFYENVQRVKDWEHFHNLYRFDCKLILSELKFKIKKTCTRRLRGDFFFWCKLYSGLEAHCSKVFMYKKYPDNFQLELCEVFQFDEVYNNMHITIEVYYIYFSNCGETLPGVVGRTERIKGRNISLMLSHLPFRRVARFTITTFNDEYYISDQNASLASNIPVIASLVKDCVKISFKEIENSPIKCL